MTLHMHSKRTVSARCVNREGMLSEHEGDGLLYVYAGGQTYDGIFPLFNWQQLPGITAIQDSEAMSKSSCNYGKSLAADSAKMDLTAVVTMSNTSGGAAMELHSHGLVAHKLYAFFPQLAVQTIGAVTYNGTKPVSTTLLAQPSNASHKLSYSKTAGNIKSVPFGTAVNVSGVCWLHDGVNGYFFVGYNSPGWAGGWEGVLTLSHQMRTGNWNRIGGSTKVEKNLVMSAVLTHLKDGGAVSYAIVPNTPLEQMQQLWAKPVTSVAHVEDAASISLGGDGAETVAAIWKAGATVSGLSADKPCLVHVNASSIGVASFSYAAQEQVTVTVNGKSHKLTTSGGRTSISALKLDDGEATRR